MRITKFSLPLLFSFFILFLIEIFLRAFVVDRGRIANYGFNLQGLGDLLPNKKFLDKNVEDLPYLVITNSSGFRNKEELISEEKEVFTILAIGDSFTYGPYVNNQDTWPAVLQKKLRKKYKDKKIQVLNAGVAGYTITDEFEYLKEKGIRTNPDLVILAIYANDINDLKPEKRKIYARSKQKEREKGIAAFLRRGVKKTAIFNFAERLRVSFLTEKLKKKKNEISENDQQRYLQEYLKSLAEFIEFCQNKEIKLLIVLFPEISQLGDNNRHFQENIIGNITNKVDFIDLLPVFIQKSVHDLYLLPFNRHLGSYGYLVAAETIFNYLANNELIDNL